MSCTPLPLCYTFEIALLVFITMCIEHESRRLSTMPVVLQWSS